MAEKKAWDKRSAVDTLTVLGFRKEAEMLERGEIKSVEEAFTQARERLAKQQREFAELRREAANQQRAKRRRR